MATPAAPITMSMREADRLKTIQAVVDRMARVAAQRLGLSRRQLERLVQRYKDEGAAVLVSRKRGRSSNHQLAPGVSDRAIGLIRKCYADFGPTLASEKLSERHGLTLGVETVRTLMTAAGLWTPREQRAAKIHQPRNRRACVGELIQIDGSDHAWFEARAGACTLLVFIDDATSRLMQLHFVPTESAPANRKLMHRYIDVFEYPDGRIELRSDGANLAYERYDRLPQVDTAAIVENKRLSHALQAALVIQAQRDDRRISNTPSRTNQGQAPYPRKALPGTKRSRQITATDMELAVKKVCGSEGALASG